MVADYKLQIDPVDVRDERTVAIATRQVLDRLLESQFIEHVDREAGPPQADTKAAEAVGIASLAVTLAPIALEQLFGLLRDYFNRSGAPGIMIRVKDGESEISVQFSPSDLDNRKILTLAERLRARLVD